MNPDRIVAATTNISAPAQDVWAVLTDFERYSKWHPALSIERPLSIGAGSLLEGRAFAGDGQTSKFMATIVEVARPRRLVWEGGIRGILVGSHSFLLVQRGDGTTDVTDSEEFSGVEADTFLAERPELVDTYELNGAALKRYVEGPETP